MSLLKKIFGDASSDFIKGTKEKVAKINALEEQISKLQDSDFPKKTQEFKDRIKKGESLDDILPEAFALVREAQKRTLGLRLYDVQLIGGMTLHSGKIAEMKTGEGKT
ncbi:MAG: preprotein translocase subunit SecA, partial [Methanothrix sp.]|nr:preprotein translocase subunit SecA [Methanothrix sp.]